MWPGGEEDEEREGLLARAPQKPTTPARRAFVLLGMLAGFGCATLIAAVPRRGTASSPPLAPPPLPPSPSPRPIGPPPTVSLRTYRHVLNESLGWAKETVPAFESADADLSLAYWYRWRLFHLHMRLGKKGAHGCRQARGCWVLTEFLKKVFWSGPLNTIVAPAGHHIMEGRWIRDDEVVDDYARFWFDGPGFRKQYTFWGAHALWQRSLLRTGGEGAGVVAELYPQLRSNYFDWVRTHYSDKGKCMFQSCHADGEENSAGLDGCRPTINSVMYGEASALAAIAAALGNGTEASRFKSEARRWQAVLTEQLWSDEHSFFVNVAQPPPRSLHDEIRRYNAMKRGREVQTYFGCLACHRPRTCPPERGWPNGRRVPVRELMGLSSPWYFSAVPKAPAALSAKYASAFAQLHDPSGFGAPYGPRTTERRSACYNFSNSAQCNWNGPTWPFETSKVATALINLLHTYPPQPTVGVADFEALLSTYARAHTRSHVGHGGQTPHVDEDLHPDEGYWITRRKLHGVKPWPKAGGMGNPRDPLRERGKHYFHSSFNDVVLSGLVGIRPSADSFEVAPLVSSRGVKWFAATGIRVRWFDVAVVWDADGERYGHGAGLHLWLDGRHAASAPPTEAGGAPRLKVWPDGRVETRGGAKIA